MHKLTRHFVTLLKAIEPPPGRARLAKSMPGRVRKHIEQSEELETVEPHTTLIGSYARHTAVGQIKDVDILVCVDSGYHRERPSLVIGELADVLEDLPGSGSIDVREQRRSVRVEFHKPDFVLDLVPAVLLSGVDSPLYVPDRQQGSWVLSSPVGYGDYLSELNQRGCGRIVRLVKLLKYWRDVHMKRKRPKSYWLEAQVASLAQRGVGMSKTSRAELFTEAVNLMYSDFELTWTLGGGVPSIADPMLGHNVAANWPRDHFESFMRHLDATRDWCNRALAEEDLEKCVVLWCRVFGEEFRTRLVAQATRRAELSSKGVLGVTPTGGMVEGGGVAPVRAHHFYGE